MQVDLAGGHERLDAADHFKFKAALVVGDDAGFDDGPALEVFPCRTGDRAFTGEDDQAFGFVNALNDEVHDRAQARRTVELRQRDDALMLGVEAGEFNKHIVATDFADPAALELLLKAGLRGGSVQSLGVDGFGGRGFRRGDCRLHDLIDRLAFHALRQFALDFGIDGVCGADIGTIFVHLTHTLSKIRGTPRSESVTRKRSGAK